MDGAWRTASVLILWSSIGGRLLIGGLADRFSKKWVMTATYFLVAGTIPILLMVRPSNEMYLYAFAILFGFGMGADYMLIPLMAAEQFGVNSLARAMAVILPVNTIGQTWFPYFVSVLRDAPATTRRDGRGAGGGVDRRAIDRDPAAGTEQVSQPASASNRVKALLREREVHVHLRDHFHRIAVQQRRLVDPLLHRLLGGLGQHRISGHERHDSAPCRLCRS